MNNPEKPGDNPEEAQKDPEKFEDLSPKRQQAILDTARAVVAEIENEKNKGKKKH